MTNVFIEDARRLENELRDKDGLNEEIKQLMGNILSDIQKQVVHDWKFKDDTQRKMRKSIKIRLLKLIKGDKRGALVIELVELANRRL